jgi:hypothetical protein
MAVKNLPKRGTTNNKYVMWAIDPKNKPSMSDMRIAFLASDDRLLRDGSHTLLLGENRL